MAKFRKVPGYHEISHQYVTFVGYRAFRWEFKVLEHGVLVRKVDIFFIDRSRNGWGVLFQAPAAQWATASPRLQATVATIRLHT